MSVKEEAVIETNDDEQVVYRRESIPEDVLILYTPHQIHGREAAGTDAECLLLGVIPNITLKDPVIIRYRDGDIMLAGINLFAVSVKSPGLYSVGLQFNSETIYKVDPPVIITAAEGSNSKEVADEAIPENIASAEDYHFSMMGIEQFTN